MSKVRVLVVDDSATIRGIITSTLSRDPEIEVVGAAGDPLEARAAIKDLNPDVVTLDVEMPKMSGIEFLEKIMRLRPMPVIMVSTLTQAGAATSIEALELGAFDCVGKPDFSGLAEKVKAAARSRVRALGERATLARPRVGYRPSSKILAIGSSTGGVEALLNVLSNFPENCPPTVITQHMPPTFTASFAARLDRTCAPKVQEATDGAPIMPGTIYLAPGGLAHLEVTGGTHPRCRLREGPPMSGHRPSVDALFTSVAQMYGRRAVGVILTGMGRDGAAGLRAMRDAGAATLGQDESTSIVYGMPKAAFEAGAVERQLPLGAIGAAALDLCALEMKGAA
ncbi:MAG: chemotaxis response regulator protein-glutamate methylesterase [Hyphomonadaceae bacterium]